MYQDLAPVAAEDLPYLNDRLAEILDLMMPSGDAERIAAWLARATHVLHTRPASLLDEAITAAQETCRFPSEVVPFVVARCEEKARPLAAHRATLERIVKAIGGDDR